jgi:N-acetylglucosaminyl-diphospho-decaprenol L-rhamnosyltransferase
MQGFYSAIGDACVSVSIVSHGHGQMVGNLVARLQSYPEVGRIILTRNIPDCDEVVETENTLIIQNVAPKGFGSNHNAAFAHSTTPFFCVLNPDIELPANPFTALLAAMDGSSAALIAPSVVNSAGVAEDSARSFPTLRQLTTKLLGGHDGRYALEPNQEPMPVDWVAGMFMLFRANDYNAIGGFDEKFFLYYEDVDICTRLWKAGRPIKVCPQVQVVHDAQRASRKNWQFKKWHAASMARYFCKHWGRFPRGSAL